MPQHLLREFRLWLMKRGNKVRFIILLSVQLLELIFHQDFFPWGSLKNLSIDEREEISKFILNTLSVILQKIGSFFIYINDFFVGQEIGA